MENTDVPNKEIIKIITAHTLHVNIDNMGQFVKQNTLCILAFPIGFSILT